MGVPAVHDGVVRRSRERHAAAVIRAISGRPDAELRGGQLRVADRPVVVATPFVGLDHESAHQRGGADGLGVLLCNCDLELHDRLGPHEPFQRIVFDVLEQLRCEALTPASLRGARANLDVAFAAWDEAVRADRIDESRSGMLVYTLTHMARSRLTGRSVDEHVDELIETTRGHLGPIIGHALRELRPNRSDQEAFARPALEIARLLFDIVGDTTTRPAERELGRRFRLVIPRGWTTSDELDGGDGVADGSSDRPVAAIDAPLATLGDYSVFTREHDRVVAGTTLVGPARRRVLRGELDALCAAQAVSAPGLARRLLALFGTPADDDWIFGVDHGALDGRRLAQLVVRPDHHDVFRRRRRLRTADTVVSFLVDNSGSMKRQRHEAIAVLVDTFSRALDLAGVANEVLGFTTGAWSGGLPLTEWRSAGEPPDPGRLNETLHVVYKDADTSWRRARPSLAAMLSTHHYRESVDGEAVAWAHDRLLLRPEPRRVLVVVSDGAPNDSATANSNREGLLDDHLRAVTDTIERRHRLGVPGAVELAAIGVDLDVTATYRRSVGLDLGGTLGLSHYRVLETLLSRTR